jgi:hypothetical protein
MLVCAALLAGCCYFVFLQPLPGIPAFEKTRSAHVKSEGILLDRNGKVIHELRIHGQGRRLDWTALCDISPALQSAVVLLKIAVLSSVVSIGCPPAVHLEDVRRIAEVAVITSISRNAGSPRLDLSRRSFQLRRVRPRATNSPGQTGNTGLI